MSPHSPQRSHQVFLTLLCVCACLLISAGWEEGDQRGVAVKTPKPGPPVTLYKESHALVIGVSNYTAGWPRLPGVKEDLNAVIRVLKTKGFHVVVVENPTKDEMERAYDDFIVQYGLRPDNRLLLYFAGHGYTHKPSYATDDPQEWMGYIVARDAPLPGAEMGPFFRRALSMQRFADIARRIEAKHVLFIFDSCFSGSIFALSRAKPPDEGVLKLAAKPVRQFISSGTVDQEVSDAGGFRRQFIAALDGAADRNRDGYVTGSELGLYLQETVPTYEKQTPQYGKIRDPLLDKGDFVFPVGAMPVEVASIPPAAPPSPALEVQKKPERAEKAASPRPAPLPPVPSPPSVKQDVQEASSVTPPPPPLRMQGYLQVNVNVDAVNVSVDGKSVGVAQRNKPLEIRDLAAGMVRVRVEAEGYERQERVVSITMDKWVQEAFVLNRLPVPEKPLPPPAQNLDALQSPPQPQPTQEAGRTSTEVGAGLRPAPTPSQLVPHLPEDEQSDDIVTYWTVDPSGRPVPLSKPGKGSQKKAKGN